MRTMTTTTTRTMSGLTFTRSDRSLYQQPNVILAIVMMMMIPFHLCQPSPPDPASITLILLILSTYRLTSY